MHNNIHTEQRRLKPRGKLANEETEINHLDNAILMVTRNFRSRTDTTGYQSLATSWTDLSPIISEILTLPSVSLATQYLLRVTGDFHDHLSVLPATAAELESYLTRVDEVWTELFQRATDGLSMTDRVRVANVLRDGRDRADAVGVRKVVGEEGVVPVYERALKAAVGVDG
ncbi:hypothetical protein BC938DRAFT_475577 [Jimgerdemannia flammicorona]|uniref:Uncharacterized protein n=1 Tax=Jimgerdemannia flammicorona TaxID=994334 RepID=A0A433QRH0_9FUNG|nr:hypothetical protein BC938DRAFT_475577 [Jimgerdemannia flammicorona]